MRAILTTIIAMLTPVMAASQPALARADVEAIVGQILSTRQAILRDSTPVNFCAWPAVFDRNGRPEGARGGVARMFVPQSECARKADLHPATPNVRIRSVRTRGDTTIVETDTDFGGLQYWDEYRCARDGQFMMCRFSLLGWVEK